MLLLSQPSCSMCVCQPYILRSEWLMALAFIPLDTPPPVGPSLLARATQEQITFFSPVFSVSSILKTILRSFSCLTPLCMRSVTNNTRYMGMLCPTDATITGRRIFEAKSALLQHIRWRNPQGPSITHLARNSYYHHVHAKKPRAAKLCSYRDGGRTRANRHSILTHRYSHAIMGMSIHKFAPHGTS